MFGAILKATNCSFQKGITLCRSIYVTKVMKLLAFIFEQPSYSAIVLCFVVRYFVSILVLQSSRWGIESWLLCFVCLSSVS